MIVMLRLDKGIVFPKTSINKTFEEVKERAFEGSDYGYEEESLFEKVIGYIVFYGFLAFAIFVVTFLIKRKIAIRKFYKNAQYFRDVPNGSQIDISYYLSQNFDVAKDKSLIIGALILSMINKGIIEVQTDENVGIFGKVKQSVNLKLVKEPENDSEKSLYSLLISSAGEDGILQEKELEKYAYKYPDKVTDVIVDIKVAGEGKFISLGGFEKNEGNCINNLSDKGKEELAEVMGLKKYLEEFTLISEREISETIIWKEYMIYAALFGIADKVMKQFEKVYPDRVPEFRDYNRNVVVAYSYNTSMYRSAQKAIQQRRTSGGGGSSSLGGGGGFSGGGHGGGSR